VTAHGWAKLAPWTWDIQNNELSRPERLETGRIVLIKVSQPDTQSFNLQIDAHSLEQKERENLESTVRRWLSLDWDSRSAIETAKNIDPRVSQFIKQGGGRFLRSSTFYEDFVKTVCTVNANWGFTIRMVSSLVNLIGEGLFPTPIQVIEKGKEFLRQEVRLGFRARVLAELSRQLFDQRIVDCQGNLINTNLNFEYLIRLRGIGQYSASHLMMLCHDFGRIPIDSEVIRYCKEHYHIESGEIDTFFEKWGEYRFLGYKLSRIIDNINWTE